MDKQDILFGALQGSKVLPSLERFNLVQAHLNNKALPSIPTLPVKNNLWQADKQKDYAQMFFPLRLKLYSNEDKDPNKKLSDYKKLPRFLFPFEPLVSVSSGNTIIESFISTQGDAFRGTVKERIYKKDWDITITGVLIGKSEIGKVEDCYPSDDLVFLFEYLKVAKSIEVEHHLLTELGILKLVVYDYSFPFTKGENVQAYELKCKSDNELNLIIPDYE